MQKKDPQKVKKKRQGKNAFPFVPCIMTIKNMINNDGEIGQIGLIRDLELVSLSVLVKFGVTAYLVLFA